MDKHVRAIPGGLLLFSFFSLVSAWAADEQKIFVTASESRTVIRGLQLSTAPIDPEPGQRNYDIVAKMELRGRFKRQDWHLLIDNLEVAAESDGSFRVPVVLSGPSAQVHFSAVGPNGDIERQTVGLKFPGFAFWSADLKDPLRKRHSFSATIGATLLGYEETFSEPLNQIAMTGKLAYTYFLSPPRWDVGASAYLNLATVSTNQAGKTARFLGINARIGYVAPAVKEPWRLSVMAGAYYVSMFVTGNEFGFKNLMGPQLFPVLRKMLPTGDSVVGYLKFSPVGSGLSFVNLGSREVGFGASYIRRLKGLHALSVGLDFADLRLNIEGIDIVSRSLSLGLGYAW